MAHHHWSALFCLFQSSAPVLAPAHATVTRVSEGASGFPGNDESLWPGISADGRFVVFSSRAPDLVIGDTNGFVDVFVRDRRFGTITRASVNSAGVQGNGDCDHPTISADGRFVAFPSYASNLVPGDTINTSDVFVRDLQSGLTVRGSVDPGGGQANGHSAQARISADGRHVAFSSSASNLVPGDTNGTQDVFVRVLETATTVRVSLDSAGGESPRGGSNPSISADGRHVAFLSYSLLAPGDQGNRKDVYVRDLVLGITTLATVDSNGHQGNQNQGANFPSISSTGDKVSFLSWADNLVPGDTNGLPDIFLRDLVSGTTTRVNVSSSGAQANLGSQQHVSPITRDGRFLVFTSEASNLFPGDRNGEWDVFVRDLLLGRTLLVSAASFGHPGDGNSSMPAISADGRHIAFVSGASNLVPAGSNGFLQVYVVSQFLR